MVNAISEGLRLLFICKEKEQRQTLTKLPGRTGHQYRKLEAKLGRTEEKHGKGSLVWLIECARLTVLMNQIICLEVKTSPKMKTVSLFQYRWFEVTGSFGPMHPKQPVPLAAGITKPAQNKELLHYNQELN